MSIRLWFLSTTCDKPKQLVNSSRPYAAAVMKMMMMMMMMTERCWCCQFIWVSISHWRAVNANVARQCTDYVAPCSGLNLRTVKVRHSSLLARLTPCRVFWSIAPKSLRETFKPIIMDGLQAIAFVTSSSDWYYWDATNCSLSQRVSTRILLAN